ncbi:MAG: gluconate 2-dehydrogenase subunit 3 family protein [Acetobacteraceae bacterium]|nr:gluconate 2-dehydrogenase subunit 3 family protein [Acetobacteraceae bacterium]
MADPRARYRGYDVLDKRDTPSWNDADREVLDARLAVAPEDRNFFTAEEWVTVKAVCDRITPQTDRHPRIPVAALLDRKMHENRADGYRRASLPPMQEAWRIALKALDEEARLRFGAAFHDLTPGRQDTLLELVQQGDVRSPAWERIPPQEFFRDRVLHDIVPCYYSHPYAWNEIGFGGPASIRGYVRMDADRRDPWEAVEHKDV